MPSGVSLETSSKVARAQGVVALLAGSRANMPDSSWERLTGQLYRDSIEGRLGGRRVTGID